MSAKQHIFRVRRNYNQWVNNQTLEDYALRFTAKHARRWSLSRVANTALGAISFLALEAIGGSMTLLYGFSNTFIAIVVVSAVIFMTALPICYYAAKYGVDIDLLTRGSGFGYIGSTFTSLIYASFTFIFFALEAAIMASAIDQLFDIPLFYGYIFCSIIIIPLVTHGITVISRFQLWTQPLWAFLQILPFYFIFTLNPDALSEWVQFGSNDIDDSLIFSTFNLAAFGAACAVLFSLMSQVGEQVDFLRFLPPKTQENKVRWWFALLFAGPGWILIGGLKLLIGSFLAYLALEHQVPAEQASDPIQMYVTAFSYVSDSSDWILLLAGTFVILSQLKINVTNAYAGSLAWSNFFSRLTHSHPGRVVWLVFNVVIALVLMELGIYHTFEQTLGLYAIIALGWLGALVSDLVINKPLGLSPKHIEFKRAHLYDINPVGMGAMLLSSSVGLCCYLEYLGEILQALSPFITLLLALLLTPLLALLTKSQYYIARSPLFFSPKTPTIKALNLPDTNHLTTAHSEPTSTFQTLSIKPQKTRRCIVCHIHYEHEDMAFCPAYEGTICSLCCSLDARCGDSCKPIKKFHEWLKEKFQPTLPKSMLVFLNERFIYFTLQLFLVATLTALMLSLIYDSSITLDSQLNEILSNTLYKVFFLLMIIAGVICWLFVLAHESRIVAQEESHRQTKRLREEILAHEKTDQALQQAKEQAEAANSAKSRYLTGISHELRSPLNAMLGYTQLLETDRDIPDTKKHSLSVIRRSGEHLSDLIEGLLDVSRIEAGRLDIHRESVQLHSLLDQLVSMFSLQSQQKNLSFQYHCEKSVPAVVMTDEKRLRQILINLLSNAIKFTQTGGVHFSVAYKNQVAVFKVKDSGIGIAEEDLERIFNPFERIRRTGMPYIPGTGLGLTITRLLVDILGGEIKVATSLGSGCTFTVWLMLSSQERTQHALPSKRMTGYIGSRMTIMVVDDDPTQRSLLSDLLTPLGFSIIEAPDVPLAIKLLEHQSIDLFLLDVEMPGQTGWELAHWLKNKNHLAPRFMLSANAHESHQPFTDSKLIQGYIIKPFRLGILLEKIATALNLEWQYETSPNPKEASTLSSSQTITSFNEDALKTANSTLENHDQEQKKGGDHQNHVDASSTLPSDFQLIQMIQMAENGNLSGIKHQFNQWQQQTPTVSISFMNKLLTTIENVQLSELINLLQQALSTHEGQQP